MRFVTMCVPAMCLFVVAASLLAGPLTPPPGPVGPTGKTLTEVEPRIAINATNTPGDANSVFKITQPGSYYLTGNVTGVSGRHGVEIAADHVTFDLMGFAILGVAGSLDGVATEGNRSNITIRNGTVRGWGVSGIDLIRGGNGGRGALVERVHASNNTLYGIRAGVVSVVRVCTTYSNGNTGIITGTYSIVEDCTARSNGNNGITVGNVSQVNRCVASGNAGSGITGSSGSSGSSGSIIADCVAQNNTNSGIVVFWECYVSRNTCTGNSSSSATAGIYVFGTNNRIDSNNSTDNNYFGMYVLEGGNFITRNTCSDNVMGNWEIAAGNRILVINAASAGAISGNAGGVSPGSNDPNANYTY